MENSQNVFSNRNFRVLWLGALVCLIGDQLSLIALPWLVLKLTNSALAVGSVLAVIGVPRAIFILVGGTMTDRFEPKNVLLYARAISALLLFLLSILVWMDAINMPLLYLFALLLGLASAFTLPAGMAILPTLLPPQQLQAGSGIMMSSMQLSAVIGPILAGYVIAAFGQGSSSLQLVSDAVGIAIIFAVDGFSFLASVFSLLAIKFPLRASIPDKTSLFAAVVSGYQYLKSDRSLFMYIFYIAIISFFITGPAAVGIPVLVKTKFLGNALEFGSFLTVQGIGMTLGMLLSTIFPRIPANRLGTGILLLDGLAGALVILFAQVSSIAAAFSITFCIGMIGGFIQVVAFTWIQTRVQPEYMGRIMSYLMFAALGLAPISSVLAGLLIAHTTVSTMFTLVGMMMIVIVMLGLKNASIRNMGLPINAA